MNCSHDELLHCVVTTVNPNRSDLFATTCDMKTRGERLRWAREQAGYRSARKAALEMDLPYATYNSHERAGQPGARDFSPEDAERYARKFQVALGWLITGKGDPKGGGDEVPRQLVPVSGSIGEYVVAGAVEAGSFHEVTEFFDDEMPAIHAPIDPKYPEARRMAFRVRGDSMNKATPPILPGGYILCVDYEDLNNTVPLRDGMKVVIERTKFGGQMREWSVKEVEVYEDRNEFHPRSDNPKHKPIIVKKDFEPDDGEEVRVLALVRSVYYEEP